MWYWTAGRVWPLSIWSARPDKRNGVAEAAPPGQTVLAFGSVGAGRAPHRNSKGTAFRLFLYIRVFSCVMNTRHGASGDIGFIPKASNINGLRAIEQQYLRQNQITVLDFEGVSAMERPFILPKSKARKRNQRPVVKKGAQMTFFTLK